MRIFFIEHTPAKATPLKRGIIISMNKWIKIGGIMGFLGVALGAFGAHGLKSTITPEMMDVFKTGVLYHLIHSIVILGIGFYGKEQFKKAAYFFLTGIILFSFSLYLLSITSITAFGYITPFGGVCFLIGWAMLIIVKT